MRWARAILTLALATGMVWMVWPVRVGFSGDISEPHVTPVRFELTTRAVESKPDQAMNAISLETRVLTAQPLAWDAAIYHAGIHGLSNDTHHRLVATMNDQIVNSLIRHTQASLHATSLSSRSTFRSGQSGSFQLPIGTPYVWTYQTCGSGQETFAPRTIAAERQLDLRYLAEEKEGSIHISITGGLRRFGRLIHLPFPDAPPGSELEIQLARPARAEMGVKVVLASGETALVVPKVQEIGCDAEQGPAGAWPVLLLKATVVKP